MGSSVSAEVTNLVGAYLLKCIRNEIPELQGGLYRDDTLFVVHSNNKSHIERIKKKINRFFKDFNLSITYEPGIKIANFLDITLDLNSKLHYPFRKEGEITSYVSKLSNHPPNIINSLVRNISIRISKLSSNFDIFNSHSEHYNEALFRAGYNQKITFIDIENLQTHNKLNNLNNNNHVNNKNDQAEKIRRGRFNTTSNRNGNKNKDNCIDHNMDSPDKTILDKIKKHTISNVDNNKDQARNNSRSRFTTAKYPNEIKNNNKNIVLNTCNTVKINFDNTKKHANNKYKESDDRKNNSNNPNSNSKKFNKKDIIWLNIPFNCAVLSDIQNNSSNQNYEKYTRTVSSNSNMRLLSSNYSTSNYNSPRCDTY
ncbi:probable serine/threonine-protein kinase DDB_G0283337 [Octopus sinensis]|uniref:Probable serine/threonine-protein kinase DDB_G0283337 n=1 Tax=Octopus sinensis TaxID=2607531 RepID=A0A7E6ELP1_9MOLL|nr:probable serine/threonine-protein kinase DDB_G0283337 [Octopus sinensis]